ncbi:MAG: serine/threonine protein kinase, partial [Deltaproteobacteria bacterium]
MMEINKQFGRYLIIKSLGSGATSDVFLAHDTTLERDVALKILKPALVSDQASFGRFTIEAQAASKLFHDNIATVLDMGDIDGRYYIAMRYVDGVSLDEYLRKNDRLPWESVKKLAQQIGSALAHAHTQGYLHRDIKPNNIMVSSKGDFILTDFGLTRAMLESGMTSTTGAVLGTPPYIPPEIWNGKEASPASDQYSLACVIDEAITGRSLFSGNTPQEIITKHLVNKPEISGYPAEIPVNVRFIIQKALSKASADRFPGIQA